MTMFNCAHAFEKQNEADDIRRQLYQYQDKNSPKHIKTKQKLIKFIEQNKIDYSAHSRLNDVLRLINEQKYDIAEYELFDLLSTNTEPAICYELLGDISYKSAQNTKETAQFYKNSLNYNPSNTSVLFKLSKLYLSEKKNILGLEYIKQAIESTDDTEILTEIENILKNKFVPQSRFETNISQEALGMIYIKMNNSTLAYDAFVKAIQSNPGDIYLKYYLSDLLFSNGMDKAAIVLFDVILKDNPKDSQIRASKAKALFNLGDEQKAYYEYLTLLNCYPDSKEAKYGIYKIYENKISPKEILEKINQNNAEHKITPEELNSFANFLETMGDNQGAQNFRQNAQKITDELSQKISAPKENQVQKQISQQIQKPLKQIESTPKTKDTKTQNTKKISKNTKIIQTKKQAKKEQQKTAKEQPKITQKQIVKTNNPAEYNEYQKQIAKYNAMTPKDAQIYNAIANTYKSMGDYTNALKNYEEAIKLDPANSDLRYNMGVAYLELNSPYSAKKALQKAVDLNKDNSKAYNLLSFVNQKIITEIINSSYSKFENKNYVEAFEILDNAIKQYPENAQLYYYRALVSDALGRNSAQISDLQKAISLDPSYYISYYQLGIAYEKINDERNALISYERFLSIEPDEKDLVEEVQKKVVSFGKKYY